MRALTLLPLLLLPAAPSVELTTDYAPERTLAIEWETSWSLEVTDMQMLRDGEPFEPPDDRERPSISETRQAEWHDTVLAHDDGVPTRLRREFGAVAAATERDPAPRGARGREVESPLDDVTLELTRTEDGVDVEVVEGEEPDSDHLQGQRLELALDALLPDGAVEVGDEWELDGDALLRALGLDLHAALFPPPDRSERERDEDDERGSRGRMLFSRESLSGLLARAEWQGTATLADDEEELDGVPCVRVELEIEVSGDFEEELEGGRSGSGRTETTLEVQLEGEFFFSLDEGRPILLQLEGDLSIERRATRGRAFELSVTQSGEFSHSTFVRVAD